MCTAATYKTNDFYMGRTLDYEFSYGDEITVTPRNYSFTLRHGGSWKTTMLSLAWPMLQETILFIMMPSTKKVLASQA